MRNLFFAAALCLLLRAANGQDAPSADFLKPFNVDSFSYDRLPLQTGYLRFKSSRPKLFRNFTVVSSGQSLEREVNDAIHLECPLCSIAPPNRTRLSLQPFGAKAAFTFWHGRVQLYASYGGTEAWKADGTMQGTGLQRLNPVGGINALKPVRPNLSPLWGGAHLISGDQYNDSWLVQSHLGFRIFLDSDRNVAFGMSDGYLQNTGPFGAPAWRSTNADITWTFSSIHLEKIARVFRRLSAAKTSSQLH